MNRKIQVLILIFAFAKINAQVMSCGAAPPTPPAQLITQKCPSLMDYYPQNLGNVSPLKTIVPLNFIYVQPPGGAGSRWDTVSAATSQKIVALLNKDWDTVLPPKFVLPPPYTAPFCPDIKINFSHKSTTHVTDPAYYHFLDGDAVRLTIDTNAINIFYADAVHAGEATGIPARSLIINGDTIDHYASLDMTHSGQVNMLSHEIAHCLGLWHDCLYINSQGNTASLTTSNASGTIISQIIDDYWVEDPSTWDQGGASANNIMSYFWDNGRYFTPKQIAYMHYMLKTHPLLINIPTARVPENAACLANHAYDTLINYNATLSGSLLHPVGDIIIQSGYQVTLTSCLFMREGAKIIVKPGAKFSILGGSINTFECASQWWGIEVQSTTNALQTLNSSNSSLPGTGVGMLELDHATLSNARCAVYVSEDAGLAIGNNVPGTGAGIVYSKNSTFVNNLYGMYFDTYYTLGGVTNNLSYSRRDSFIVNQDFKTTVGNAIPIHAIKIENSNGIQILGDYFQDKHLRTSTGIVVIDSDVDIRDYCASTGCSGTQIRNRFVGFRSAIDVINSFNIVPASIDHTYIDQYTSNNNTDDNTEGGIYVGNSLATRIVNNEIATQHKSYTLPYSYDLYLDNCDAYVVENNLFRSDLGPFAIGAVVNNSGPSTNNIYNNTFHTLNQGLWCQHQNYDPATGQGLTISCNDFLYLSAQMFNVGVQGYAGSTSGISVVQGTNTANEQLYARNKYSPTSGACSLNQGKFYINTPNAFVITSHGSFSVAAFQPTPQATSGCSDSLKLINKTGISPAIPIKSTYCPDTTMIAHSNSVLQAKVSRFRGIRDSLSVAYYQSLDGGNTQNLLDLISRYPSINSAQLKDSLNSRDFLSDTVLKAYFLLSGLTEGDLNQVFIHNYPLQPGVWTIASNLSIDPGILSDWNNRQHEYILSAREEKRSGITLVLNDVTLYGNEKVRRFLTDTTGPKYDSLIAHYSLNETAMSKWNLARVYIAANQIDQADALINDLESADTANTDACRMLRYTRRLATDQSYADTMRADSSIYEYLLDRATYSLKPIKEGFSRALLKIVYDHYVIPERLHPDEEEGRMANQQTQVQQVLEEKDQIVIYPNPASQSLNVKVQKNKGPFLVKITGLDGKLMIEKTCVQDCELDLQPLINGVYLLHLYRDNQLLNTKKIVVIK